jgi:hypothetical protein
MVGIKCMLMMNFGDAHDRALIYTFTFFSNGTAANDPEHLRQSKTDFCESVK